MKKLALVSILGLVLAGCGGGGDDAPIVQKKPTAQQGTIDAISGNTITVNGFNYDVADVVYRTANLHSSDLRRGMMVAITPTSARSESHIQSRSQGMQVTLEPTMTGLITDINYEVGSFKVNGIPLTFSGLSREILQNDWVMVSSLPAIIDGKPSYKVLSVVKFENNDITNYIEVEGIINHLNETGHTFKLGAALNVDYSNANELPLQGLRNGQWVEVEGSLESGVFKADEIEIESYDEIDNDTEIEGLVTLVANDLSWFELNYKGRFIINGNTRFEDGHKTQLKPGVVVEVTSLTQNNQQIAAEVEFDDGDSDTGDWAGTDIDLEGRISFVDEEQNSFTVATIHQGNQVVYVNRQTRYEDGLQFGTMLNANVEVEAYKVNGQLIASEIERED